MGLTPEERQKIYEEEKARIEAEGKTEQKEPGAKPDTTTGLEPNVAGLLCYLGWWITGIIFLVIEQKSRFVRFHALQSLIVFATIALTSFIFSWIPVVGGFLSVVISLLGVVCWIVLMVKAYQGQLYKVPVAGDLAENILPSIDTEDKKEGEISSPAPGEAPATTAVSSEKVAGKVRSYFQNTRTERVISSSFTIAWSFVILIVFYSFSEYIAYYRPETVDGITTWTRLPLLTGDLALWLPILTATMVLSIAGHLTDIPGGSPPEWPEFREYARNKYPKELDEDLITMIEDLIERRRGRYSGSRGKNF